jgi:hypothetical protein
MKIDARAMVGRSVRLADGVVGTVELIRRHNGQWRLHVNGVDDEGVAVQGDYAPSEIVGINSVELRVHNAGEGDGL